jgi:hypothetical protein
MGLGHLCVRLIYFRLHVQDVGADVGHPGRGVGVRIDLRQRLNGRSMTHAPLESKSEHQQHPQAQHRRPAPILTWPGRFHRKEREEKKD